MNQKRILITDPVHDDGIKKLKAAGFTVEERYGESPSVIKELIRDYNVLIVRSATKVTKEIICLVQYLCRQIFSGYKGIRVLYFKLDILP